MKKFVVIAAAIAAFGFVSAASAADMPVKAARAPMAPMVAPVYNWTGLYVGINGGGAWGREDWLDNGVGAPSFSPNGGVLGGQLGYRYQWNQLVLGVEGTWDWASLRDTAASAVFTEEFKIKSIYTVTGQAGWAWDRWLLYVKGGWAGARTSLDLAGGFLAGFTASHSQTANGWTIGGGIDYVVWQNWILGVEYDHFDLNYGAFTAPASNGGVPLFVTNTSRLTIDQVVGRLSYKFDWPR